jgi:hypothetical protein
MTWSAPPLVRIAAIAVAFFAAGALALRIYVEMAGPPPRDMSAALWSLARYFTILTNLLVVVVFAAVALRGRWPGAAWPAAVTVWIVAVGAVYHALLAATHHPEGLDALSNVGLHTVVPLGVFGLWLAAAPKASLGYGGPVIWSAWPLGYAIYAFLRGLADGTYPYFFLDPTDIGVAGVAAYIAGLAIFFIGSGALLVLVARQGARAR